MSRSPLLARRVFDTVSIPIAYQMGYITNSYREPSFRAIESAHGLTRPETLVLIFLGAADGSSASEICEHSGHLKSNISRAVSALEARGLVSRHAASDDLRRQHLYMTPKGRALHARFMPVLDARERAMTACLTEEERVQFDALLRKLCDHVPSWGSEPP
jgi:DNA-binding MarR family transcriptional regulator